MEIISDNIVLLFISNLYHYYIIINNGARVPGI